MYVSVCVCMHLFIHFCVISSLAQISRWKWSFVLAVFTGYSWNVTACVIQPVLRTPGTGMEFLNNIKEGFSGSTLTQTTVLHVLFKDPNISALHQCVRTPQYTDMRPNIMCL